MSHLLRSIGFGLLVGIVVTLLMGIGYWLKSTEVTPVPLPPVVTPIPSLPKTSFTDRPLTKPCPYNPKDRCREYSL